jgi:hypothetical protein
LTDVEAPQVTDAHVDFEVEDTEEAEVDDDVDVDVEVVVKGRMRTANPMSILRDVPLDVQAVVFAGPHYHDHHDPGPSVEPLSGLAQGKTDSSKDSVWTLSVSSIHMRGKLQDPKPRIGISHSRINYLDL